jgi:hypothetical protein
MAIRAAPVWLLLLVIAVLSGTLRAALLEPRVGEQTAHVVGTLAVVALFAAVITATVRWIVPDLAPRRLITLGVAWTAATVIFEFAFGRYIAGHPWDTLLEDYNLAQGRLWTLVILTLLLTPTLAGRARSR